MWFGKCCDFSLKVGFGGICAGDVVAGEVCAELNLYDQQSDPVSVGCFRRSARTNFRRKVAISVGGKRQKGQSTTGKHHEYNSYKKSPKTLNISGQMNPS